VPSVPVVCVLAAVVMTAIAAWTDFRTGHIPNWLTLPPLFLGPLLWGAYGGLWRLDGGSLVGSLLSMFGCALVPFLLFRKSAMGGGDVKLFAAIGALALVTTGLEAQFYACCAGIVFGFARLAWHGKLLRVLANTVFLAMNPVLPKKWRRPICPESMSQIRFGSAIFVGTLTAAATSGWLVPLWTPH
jgi:prepilin peptidase CpaA